MWRIVYGDFTRGDARLLWSPLRSDGAEVEAMSFEWSLLGKAGALELTVPPTHQLYDELTPRAPSMYVEVWNTDHSDDFPWWRGVVTDYGYELKSESDHLQRTVTVAGELSELARSVVPESKAKYGPAGGKSGAERAIEWLLAAHNAQTGQAFAVGTVDLAGADEVTVDTDGKTTTIDVLRSLVVDGLGGYMYLRYDGGVYLDAVSAFRDADGSRIVASQYVELGDNVTSAGTEVGGAGIVTALKPFGARLSDTSYLGEYYQDYAPQTTRPSDWDDNYGDYMTPKVATPLTSEPTGWDLSPRDAAEAGLKSWRQYWFYRESDRLWHSTSEFSTRPIFLDRDSAGHPVFWDSDGDPNTIRPLSDSKFMKAVEGFGYSRLDDRPAGDDWASGVYEPLIVNVLIPYQVGNSVTNLLCAACSFVTPEATYEPVQFSKMPEHWYWENARDNYASWYQYPRDSQGYLLPTQKEPTTGQDIHTYEQVHKQYTNKDMDLSKWSKNWANYYWRDPSADDGFSPIPQYTLYKDLESGFSDKKWRKSYEECYYTEFDDKWGTLKYKKYQPVWKPVKKNSKVYNPDTGALETLTKDTWKKLRGNVWGGTSGKGDNAKGSSHMKSRKWSKGMSLRNGRLYTSDSDKKGTELWYKMPPSNASSGHPNNCYMQAAPKRTLKGEDGVYRHTVPSWDYSSRYFRRVEPQWQKGRYYIQRGGDVAPYQGDDPLAGHTTWPRGGGWSPVPIYRATGDGSRPLTLSMMHDGDEAAMMPDAIRRAGYTGSPDIDGDLLVETESEYSAGVAVAEFPDATTFEQLLQMSLERLDALRVPEVECDIAAVDTSDGSWDSMLLVGRYAWLVYPQNGWGSKSAPVLVPIVGMSGYSFADRTKGSVTLGVSRDLLAAMRTVSAEGGDATRQIVFSKSAETLWREGTGA